MTARNLAISLAFIPACAFAQWGGAIGGAMSGMGRALEDWNRSMMDAEIQRQLMRERHQQEMERIEREQELRMEAIRREAQAREQAERQAGANTCVSTSAYVGQRITNRETGKTGTLRQLHSRSARCRSDEIPILATMPVSLHR